MRTIIPAASSVIVLLAWSLSCAAETMPAMQPQPAVQTQTAPAPTPASSSGDPLICHGVVHEGVLLRKPECHTQKEWDRIQFETQQSIFRFQQQSLTGPVH